MTPLSPLSHLGGVNVITDGSGARCQLNEYDPWGADARSEGPTPGSPATCDPTHRFTGQELDPESGLYYYGGRYYDQEISRFVSPDPFVQSPDDPQNLNRYSYVLNNPQGYIDPSGYEYEDGGGGGGDGSYVIPFYGWYKFFSNLFGGHEKKEVRPRPKKHAASTRHHEIEVKNNGKPKNVTVYDSQPSAGSGGTGNAGNDYPNEGGGGSWLLAASSGKYQGPQRKRPNPGKTQLPTCAFNCYAYYWIGQGNPNRPDVVQIPFSTMDPGAMPPAMEGFSSLIKTVPPGSSLMINPGMVQYQFNAGFWSSGTSTVELTGVLSGDLSGNFSFSGFVSGVDEWYNFNQPGWYNRIGEYGPGRPFFIKWVGRRPVSWSYP